MTRTLIASAFLMLSSVASATNPVALISDDPLTARVVTRDVNVQTSDGRMTVDHRIRQAARMVCVEEQDRRSVLEPRKRFADCYDLAIAKGLAQLDRLAAK